MISEYTISGFMNEMEKLASGDVREIIGQALGEASMCWSPTPSKQVFDSTRAVEILDRTAKALEKVSSKRNKLPPCKKCGNTTRDQRCGICDRCAFPNGRIGGIKIAGVQQNVGTAVKFGTRAAQYARGIGSNLGGTAKGFMHPVSGLKAGLKATVADHPMWTGLMVAGTAMDTKNALKKTDPSGEGQSRIARVARLGGGLAGGIIGTPFGLSGGMAGGLVGEKAGKTLGKGIDRLRGYKPATPVPQPQLGQQSVMP